MSIERVWRAARPFVPLRLYPLLAPAYRWRRRRQLKQLEAHDERYLRAHPDVVAPPAELRYNVAGPCTIEQFLDAGARTADDVEAALRSVGRSLGDVRDLLDFGCGCGRLILALRGLYPRLRLTGCDVDGRAIDWGERNVRGCRWVRNEPLPPSPFEDGAYDLVWCGSVFTHLDEDRQDRWLHELCRVLRPRGLLLASLHGRASWEPRLPPTALKQLEAEGLLYARFDTDAGIHPDWYQVAWHTEEYVRRHWAGVFDVLGYMPRGLHGHQDIVVAQRRA
jgi:SAM-dependent methyltransferase